MADEKKRMIKNNSQKKQIPNKMGIFTTTKLSERAADAVTEVVGSWGFIIGFLIFLGIWMAINLYAWIKVWDPYPFILLNLVLSCLAAIQAPIIMMSQNRAAQKDRQRAEYDYAVNRKAEREIEEIKKALGRIERKIGGNPKKI